MSVYTLPDGQVQICFSGGRSSAYMLHQILEANGDLPEHVIVTFQNTGREMPETLDFVNECSHRWGVQIKWLEYTYRDNKQGYQIVSHNSAARDGEPFEAVINKRKYLPNRVTRFCTIELKVRTAKRFLMDLGWREWTSAIGIRADEPKRFRPEDDKQKERWFTWQPLFHAGVTRHDVVNFWAEQPFDLGLQNIDGKTPLGNCDGCFLKSEATLSMLARDHPGRHKWWEDMEALGSRLTTNENVAKFREEFTRKELGDFVSRQGDWIFEQEGLLCQEDGGDCTG